MNEMDKVKRMLEAENALENKLNAERLKFLLPRLASLQIGAEIKFDTEGHVAAHYTNIAIDRCPGCGKLNQSNWEDLIPMIDRLMKTEPEL